MDLSRIMSQLKSFVDEREWGQFHSPQNLAKSIAIEAAELLECYQWDDKADEIQARHELADVLTYCLLLAEKYQLDVEEILLEKLEINRQKYPVEKSRGKSEKYDRL